MKLLDPNVKSLLGARGALGASFAASAADALLTAGQAWGLACALAGLWEGGALGQQLPWLALFLCCFAARQLVTLWRGSYLDAFSRHSASRLRGELAESLYELGPAAVQRKGSGALATALAEGVTQVQDYLALIIPKVTDLMVVPAVLGIVLLLLDPISGVIALVLIPCIMFYMRMLGSYAKENAARQHGRYQRMSNHFVDSLRGLPTLKAFGRSKAYTAQIEKTSESFREATVKTLRSATLSSLVLDLFRVFALAAAAILLGFRLMAGDVAILPALAVLIILPEFFAAVRRYSADFHASLDGRNQLASVLELVEEGRSARQAACTLESLPGASAGQVPSLRVEGLGFSYPQLQEGQERAFALLDVGFETSGPLKVGIVGVSGSGKTTLAQLLAGFAAPSCGSALVNGQAVESLACPAWRRLVCYIPQSPHIFCGSLADNIAFYQPGAPRTAVEEAARRAGLQPLLEQLPQGLDTVVGEGGRQLSGGQAQRLALARAFLSSDRRVLVFDEPTAHLDIETELALKESMLPLMEGRLVFFATHRLHWMRSMDLILVIDGGRLVQQGSLEELMAHDGPFSRLVEQMQGGGSHGA
ncbi:MAG: thiol reductant ABC exporter subunit CydD [Coriobacteriales bacterium]